MKRYCLAMDLKSDEKIINTYDKWHQKVWPEIIDGIKLSGIEIMEIYKVSNRLFMIMEVGTDFSFDEKTKADLAIKKVQEWEALMSQFQQNLTFAKSG